MPGTAFRWSIMPLAIAALFSLVLASCENISEGQKEPDWPKVSLVQIADNFSRPVHITHSGDGSNTLFVAEQKGRIIAVRDGAVLAAPFLDISERVSCCGERGFLGMAFPPEYSKKNYFYVTYTDRSGDTAVARYRVNTASGTADPKSEEIVLRVKQPYSNHNGGQIAFGPDGYLYIGMGDGGSGGDPHGHGQNPASLLGKMLRIDVESGKTPYGVPIDNPFIESKEYRPEIWAVGLRNPWRFSFDRKAGDLYIADVGQDRYEEIHFQPASSGGGENYGWNIMEGKHCYGSSACDMSGLVMPVAEYKHSDGCSVTGGMVYRGKKFPKLEGIYLYGDYCSGRIWGLRKTKDGWISALLKDTGFSITTFGEDENGELYVSDYENGTIYRIEAR
jgi:glucose/arabinose dehydrogenase